MEYIIISFVIILVAIIIKFALNIKIKDIKKLKELAFNKEEIKILSKLPESEDIAKSILKELNNNSDIASRSMITFLVINTSSVTIIPTTVISLRIASGSNNPTEIMTACIITTFLSSFIGLLIDRLFYFIWRRHYV